MSNIYAAKPAFFRNSTLMSVALLVTLTCMSSVLAVMAGA